MKVNDAYELLSNPDRKARYDSTGKVDEIEDNTISPFGTNFRYYGKHTSGDQPLKTPLVNNINFDDFVSSGNETLLLFYSSNITDLDGYVELLEAFNENSGKYWQLGRVDIALGTQLADQLNISQIPAFVYVRSKNETIRDPDNLTNVQNVTKRTIVKAPRPLISLLEINQFLTSPVIWPTHLFSINNQAQLDSFLSQDPLTPHIFLLTRSSVSNPRFKKLASTCRDIIYFAEVIDSDFSIGKKYNITTYPAIVSFRGPNTPPIIEDDMKRLGSFVNQYGMPTGFEFEPYSAARFCRDGCFVKIIGKDGMSQEYLNKIVHLNYTIGYATITPNLLKLGFNETGDWMVYFGEVRKYMHIAPEENLDENFFEKIRKAVGNHDVTIFSLPDNWVPDYTWPGIKNQFKFIMLGYRSFFESLPLMSLVWAGIKVLIGISILVIMILLFKKINQKLIQTKPMTNKPSVNPRKFKHN